MTTRRDFLIAAAASASRARPGARDAGAMQEALRKLVGNATIRRGKVKLDLPPLIDNGNAVPMTVSVESPMTPADHVQGDPRGHREEPAAERRERYLGPRAGRAGLSTRVRLADTQTVTAVAELSDGTFWAGTADVVVTLSACLRTR